MLCLFEYALRDVICNQMKVFFMETEHHTIKEIDNLITMHLYQNIENLVTKSLCLHTFWIIDVDLGTIMVCPCCCISIQHLSTIQRPDVKSALSDYVDTKRGLYTKM